MIATGIGIYPRPEAARLLEMSPARLRRWISGYTYWLHDATEGSAKRSRPPVIHTDIPPIDNYVALSFLELMELRVVKALITEGLSLQHIRKRGQLAAETFGTNHPFASRRIYTDGKQIFSAIGPAIGTPDVVKWQSGEIHQIISGAVFEQFLTEIDYDDTTTLATSWWPLGRTVPVVLNPKICFGAPTISGRSLRTSTVAGLARISLQAAADAYEITEREADSALHFEDMLAAA